MNASSPMIGRDPECSVLMCQLAVVFYLPRRKLHSTVSGTVRVILPTYRSRNDHVTVTALELSTLVPTTMTVYFDVLIVLAGLLGHAGLASTMDLNRTLFTPETSDLPAGTYIATGIAGVTQLAEYLDTYPDTRITRLLISDSTILDVDAKHGHLFTDESKDEIDWDDATHEKVWAVVRVFEEPLNRVFAKVALTLEALSYLAYSAGPHGAYDEWADPRLEPLLQHNYPSLTQFNFPSRHPRRDLSHPHRGLLPAVYDI
ncbi:hypothetical protein B0H14DRAFT_3556031 [Mycena olivaceomarginata]|nr:hypothetical protein B0H14DRAFT_3556031 [Mycena olivaceomarginata]